jgi:hypothetical protein
MEKIFDMVHLQVLVSQLNNKDRTLAS